MDRKKFLKQLLTFTPLMSSVFNSNAINQLNSFLPNTEKMPVLFLGHGSPMNAIEDNEFVRGFKKLSTNLPIPIAVLCISAHWETKGTYITAMEKPRTIHDFGGFPKVLYEQQYPAPGSPVLAKYIKNNIQNIHIGLNENWGLDHGAWSVLKHIYPKAEIPVLQLSLDYNKSSAEHFEIAQQLHFLRTKGVLIVGSGNMVHNLGKIAWDKMNLESYSYDWALEATYFFKKAINENNINELISYNKMGRAVQMAIPTPEHFLPLLYALALKDTKENIDYFNDKTIGGAISMTSIKIA